MAIILTINEWKKLQEKRISPEWVNMDGSIDKNVEVEFVYNEYSAKNEQPNISHLDLRSTYYLEEDKNGVNSWDYTRHALCYNMFEDDKKYGLKYIVHIGNTFYTEIENLDFIMATNKDFKLKDTDVEFYGAYDTFEEAMTVFKEKMNLDEVKYYDGYQKKTYIFEDLKNKEDIIYGFNIYKRVRKLDNITFDNIYDFAEKMKYKNDIIKVLSEEYKITEVKKN